MMVMKLMGKPHEIEENLKFFVKFFGKQTTVAEVTGEFEEASNESD